MNDCMVAPELKSFAALDVIGFNPVPHYINFPFAKVVEKIIAKYESELKLYPITNSQAILVKGDDVQIANK